MVLLNKALELSREVDKLLNQYQNEKSQENKMVLREKQEELNALVAE